MEEKNHSRQNWRNEYRHHADIHYCSKCFGIFETVNIAHDASEFGLSIIFLIFSEMKIINQIFLRK